MSEEKETKNVVVDKGAATVSHIRWGHGEMATTYANIVNVTSSREEFSLFFGVNKTWDLEEIKEITVEITHRMLLNPYGAKRLLILLMKVIEEYEFRFGPLGSGEVKHTVH